MFEMCLFIGATLWNFFNQVSWKEGYNRFCFVFEEKKCAYMYQLFVWQRWIVCTVCNGVWLSEWKPKGKETLLKQKTYACCYMHLLYMNGKMGKWVCS